MISSFGRRKSGWVLSPNQPPLSRLPAQVSQRCRKTFEPPFSLLIRAPLAAGECGRERFMLAQWCYPRTFAYCGLEVTCQSKDQ
jgi:hypothetical protein